MSDSPPIDIPRAVDILRRGGLVGVPTETVYGLAADASSVAAVRRLLRAKGRPADRPLPLLVASADALDVWAADVPEAARRLAERFWPGPLTLVLRRSSRVPDVVTAGRDTVGLRVPAHPVASALLRSFGGALATPSANVSGALSPTTAEQVRADLGDAVELVLDGGPCAVGVESTVVELTSGALVVLRPGAIGGEALRAALVDLDVALDLRPPAGHSFETRSRLELVASSDLAERARALTMAGVELAIVTWRACDNLPGGAAFVRRLPAEPEDYAQRLWTTLRQADAAGVDAVLVEEPPTPALLAALRHRAHR